jgi:phage host-nuclease inhibitor protein Gam
MIDLDTMFAQFGDMRRKVEVLLAKAGDSVGDKSAEVRTELAVFREEVQAKFDKMQGDLDKALAELIDTSVDDVTDPVAEDHHGSQRTKGKGKRGNR